MKTTRSMPREAFALRHSARNLRSLWFSRLRIRKGFGTWLTNDHHNDGVTDPGRSLSPLPDQASPASEREVDVDVDVM